MAGAEPELNTIKTENDSEMNEAVKRRKLHRLAKVHHLLATWLSNQYLRATLKSSHAAYKQMSAV
jgi:hypothetical protein